MTETPNKFRDAHAWCQRMFDSSHDSMAAEGIPMAKEIIDRENTILAALTICADAKDKLPELQAQVDAGEKAADGPWDKIIPDDGFTRIGAKKTLLAKVYSQAFRDTEEETANANFITLSANNRAILKALVEGLK